MTVREYYGRVGQRTKTMREKVDFEKNRPVEIALAYATGKPGESPTSGEPYFMYTTTDDRVFFASPTLNQKIQALVPSSYERLSICLCNGRSTGGKNQWDVRRVDPSPTENGPEVQSEPVLVGAPNGQQRTNHANGSANGNGGNGHGNGNGNGHVPAAAPPPDPRLPARRPDTYVFAFYADAVDLVIAVEKYAATCGRDLRFTSEDIRCIAATSRIDAQKQQGGR